MSSQLGIAERELEKLNQYLHPRAPHLQLHQHQRQQRRLRLVEQARTIIDIRWAELTISMKAQLRRYTIG